MRARLAAQNHRHAAAGARALIRHHLIARRYAAIHPELSALEEAIQVHRHALMGSRHTTCQGAHAIQHAPIPGIMQYPILRALRVAAAG